MKYDYCQECIRFFAHNRDNHDIWCPICGHQTVEFSSGLDMERYRRNVIGPSEDWKSGMEHGIMIDHFAGEAWGNRPLSQNNIQDLGASFKFVDWPEASLMRQSREA